MKKYLLAALLALSFSAAHADGVSCVLVRPGELEMGGDLRRHQPHGALQTCDRVVCAAKCQQAAPGQEVRRTERRVQGRGGAEFDECIAVPSALLQDDPEIVMDEGAVPAAFEYVAKRGFSAIEVVSLERVHALREALRQLWREILCCCCCGSKEEKNEECRGCAQSGHGERPLAPESWRYLPCQSPGPGACSPEPESKSAAVSL